MTQDTGPLGGKRLAAQRARQLIRQQVQSMELEVELEDDVSKKKVHCAQEGISLAKAVESCWCYCMCSSSPCGQLKLCYDCCTLPCTDIEKLAIDERSLPHAWPENRPAPANFGS